MKLISNYSICFSIIKKCQTISYSNYKKYVCYHCVTFKYNSLNILPPQLCLSFQLQLQHFNSLYIFKVICNYVGYITLVVYWDDYYC